MVAAITTPINFCLHSDCHSTLALVMVTVEVGRDCLFGNDSISATAVGLLLGGVVGGALGSLLIVGIVVGACRLWRTKHK